MRKDNVTLNLFCPFCRAETEVTVPAEGYFNWCLGETIQKAMPTVPAEDREVLVSGMCKACQKKVFGERDV